MPSIKIIFILCLLLVTANSVSSNPLVLDEENTSLFPNDTDFDDHPDLTPVSQEQFKFTPQALPFNLSLTSQKPIYHYKNTLPIRAPPYSNHKTMHQVKLDLH